VAARLCILLLAALAGPGFGAQLPKRDAPPIPVLHVTDLFRPHNDPDDHWDLACAYALAREGAYELRGILIDFPLRKDWDPDIAGASQMNQIAGLTVPVLVGAPRRIDPVASAPESGLALTGIRSFLRLLRNSPRPAVVHVLGSCRDVAMAAELEPELFAAKCAALYLNAGSGARDPEKAARLEYNVALDPASYAAIFRLRCPVYWLPCFEEVPAPPDHTMRVGPYGSFYRFRQDAILPHLSPRVQNYFADMFRHGRSGTGVAPGISGASGWLQYLLGPPDAALLEQQGAQERNMWCTAGFLHAAGLTVLRNGTIVPVTDAPQPVFTFDPIRVECDGKGITRWRDDPGANDRFILHVRDPEQYGPAMTTAMRTLLRTLP